MKLKINSIHCKNVDLIVDKDIYELIKDCFIIEHKQGTYKSIKVRFKDSDKYESLYKFVLKKEHDFYREYVRHKNDNFYDFRRRNLVVESRSNKIRERNSHNRSSSMYKGAHRHKLKNGEFCYKVNVTINKKNRFIKLFYNEKEAALCFDAVVRIIHGEDCYVNFKDERITLPQELIDKALQLKEEFLRGSVA